MKQVILWDLIERICSKEEQKLLMNLPDNFYGEFETKWNDYLMELESDIEDLKGD